MQLPATIPVPRVGPEHPSGLGRGINRLKINAPQFNDNDGDSLSDEEYVVVDMDKSITDSIVSKIPKKKSRRQQPRDEKHFEGGVSGEQKGFGHK